MGEWKEDALHHKYDPLPEDDPRHRKKAKKQRERSDHKHEYETVAIMGAGAYYRDGEIYEHPYIGKRCKVCGRLCNNWKSLRGADKVPDGMRVFRIDGLLALLVAKVLTEDMEVKDE